MGVQPGRQSDNLLSLAPPLDVRTVGTPDLQAETVRSNIDRREQH
jgi:hypothetical protein